MVMCSLLHQRAAWVQWKQSESQGCSKHACCSSSCLNWAIWPVAVQPSSSAPHWPNCFWLTHPSNTPPLQLTCLLTFYRFLPRPLNIPKQESCTEHVCAHHITPKPREPADPIGTAFAAVEQLPAYQNYLQTDSHGCHVQPFPHLSDLSLFCTHAATRHSSMHGEQRGFMSSPWCILRKTCHRLPSEDVKCQNPPLKIVLFNVSMILSNQNQWKLLRIVYDKTLATT